MRRTRSLAALGVVFAAACSSSPSDSSAIAPMPSSLVETETALEQSRDVCFASVGAQRRVIATELDRRSPEIEQWLATQPPEDAQYRRVQLGPIVVRELLHPLPPSPQSQSMDWGTLGVRLDAMGGTPIDAAWVSYNERARALFVDDWYRVRGGFDYSQAAASRRAAPGLMFLSYGVRRAGQQLIIKLDPGPFSEVTTALAGYIEPVWTSSRIQLQIEWAPGDPDAFRFVVDAGPGGRSFVSFTDATIHLFGDVRAHSIAHEVGHALGFRDHYQTTFDATRCTYQQTTDATDIMADSVRGSVTDDEWAALEEAYPTW
jgi:hypothetical protein